MNSTVDSATPQFEQTTAIIDTAGTFSGIDGFEAMVSELAPPLAHEWPQKRRIRLDQAGFSSTATGIRIA